MKFYLLAVFVWTVIPSRAFEAVDSELARKLFEKGDSLLQNAQYDSSIACFSLASEFFKNSDPASRLRSMNKLAEAHYRLNNYSESKRLCIEVLKGASHLSSGYDLIMAEAYNGLGNILLANELFDSAILLYTRSYDLRVGSLGQYDPLVAGSLNNLGLSYKSVGDYEKALELMSQALNISELAQDSINQGKFLNNIGNVYRHKGNYYAAISYYNKALEISEHTLPLEHPSRAFVFDNLGSAYNALGQNDLALQYRLMAWELITNSLGRGRNIREANNLGNIGNSYTELGQLNTALSYHKSALAILDLQGKSESLSAASTYENIGLVHYRLEEYDQALIQHRRALRIRQDLLNSRHHVAISHKEIASIFIETRNYDSARYHLDIALEIAKEQLGAKNRFTGEVYMLLADVYLETEETISALQYCQKALQAIVYDFNDNSLYSLPSLSNYSDPLLLLRILRRRGQALFRLGVSNKDDALIKHGVNSYELGLELIDLIRQSSLSFSDKINFGREASKTYVEMIELAFYSYVNSGQTADLELSLFASERSKAGTLKEVIAIRQNKQNFGVPDSLLQKEQNYILDISFYETELLKEKSKLNPDPAKVSRFAEILFKTKRRSEEFLLQLRKQYPQYYQLNYVNTPYHIEELKQKLRPTEAIIEYFLSDSSLFTFLITNQEFKGSRVPIDSLTKTIQQFALATQTSDFSNPEFYQVYISSSRRLFQQLLEPTLDHLPSGITKLIIIPDKEIGYLSFEALLTTDPNPLNDDPNNLPYLLRNYTVSYNYSSSLLFDPPKATRRPKSAFGGFAPTYQSQMAGNSSLNALNYNQLEVQQIAQDLHGSPWLGEAATESRFKQLAADYQILHLAMHAQVDDRDPLYSKLAFSPSQNSIEDGWLHVFEIFNLKLNSDLVVLSACNTGFGKLEKGEGIMSLARGFAYAGCPSVLMSHWPVNDQTTASLMKAFYGYLGEGMEKDLALQQARLDYLREAGPVLSHPYFWAGFVLLGDTNPIEIPNTNYRLLAGFSLTFLTLAFIFLGRKNLIQAVAKLS